MFGFLNFHKPLDCTSHDCVARIRRLLHTKKVGHGGTLDPAASGVLPLAIGQATRLLPYLPEEKAYRGRIRFGIKTTTDDLQGEVLESHSAEHLTLRDLETLLPEFLGKITQIPPRYSAIQVQGKRLYDLARSGENFEVPSRQVEIFSLKLLDWQTYPYPELELDIECGAGTYIRSLARDWGDRLGVGATLAGLVRTRSSGFDLDKSLTLEEISALYEGGELSLIEPAIALKKMPKIQLEARELLSWSQGKKLCRPVQEKELILLSQQDTNRAIAGEPPILDEPEKTGIRVAVYDHYDRFLGIAQYTLLEPDEIPAIHETDPSGLEDLSESQFPQDSSKTRSLYYRLAPKIVFPVP
jgi:tRNA pseudouridine55 synthase